ncbi:hypothetical protein ACIO93_18470 [Streptomyces sp. NPDC087903]|uniref:hypothetical protein n=1 Tax=Streptomyces sp. NPDC087903 TaxID=3365819 RepID=UPI0037F559B2
METGGARRPGAALGFALSSALMTGALLSACGESGSTATTEPRTVTTADSAHPASASAAATPPADLCTRIVAHWSREALAENTYGDYQSMGLSNGQYAILRNVVDAARAVKKRQGAGAADRLIDRRAREDCEERYRAGGPSDGPWQ